MRAVIQRATRAKVTVAGEVVGQLLAPGLVVLVGIHKDDAAADVAYLVRKIAELRILAEEKSALEMNCPLLLVSQFTLQAQIKKGRRPSWNAAAKGDAALTLFNEVVTGLQALGLSVQTGEFGANMQVELVNDGPVTIWVDSGESKN